MKWTQRGKDVFGSGDGHGRDTTILAQSGRAGHRLRCQHKTSGRAGRAAYRLRLGDGDTSLRRVAAAVAVRREDRPAVPALQCGLERTEVPAGCTASDDDSVKRAAIVATQAHILGVSNRVSSRGMRRGVGGSGAPPRQKGEQARLVLTRFGAEEAACAWRQPIPRPTVFYLIFCLLHRFIYFICLFTREIKVPANPACDYSLGQMGQVQPPPLPPPALPLPS